MAVAAIVPLLPMPPAKMLTPRTVMPEAKAEAFAHEHALLLAPKLAVAVAVAFA